ncbi:MAG: TIGR03936 family radical SAM-associated protein [Eubacteriales bacterium]|nr:TIGR03936 family radical SAM-associated protein [Eubacteriales bacterium]
MKIRIKFAKYGALRFIGHLDVMRFFQKAIRRAGIDVAYSGGYSPHQIMTFAAPLGVGMCSTGEYMDIEIHSHQGGADLMDRLKKACPPGIDILNVKALPDKAGNAMASVAAATYAVAFKDRTRSFADYAGFLKPFMDQREILITKETKRSSMEVNIRPGIYECRIEDGTLCFLVDASSSGNIRPNFVTERFLDFAGVLVPEIELQTIRIETWMNAGTQEAPDFVPLDAIGEEF